MGTITITKTYNDGDVLLEADLDPFIDDTETFLNTTQLNDDNIGTYPTKDGITASLKLTDASISTGKLAANVVTTVKINDEAVTTEKINTSAVTTAKLATSAVTTAKIANINVTTAKILNDAVTSAKMTPNTAQLSAGTASALPTSLSGSTGWYDLGTTEFTLSITTTGRPVRLQLVPTSASSGSNISLQSVGGAYTGISDALRLVRGASDVVMTFKAENVANSFTGGIDYANQCSEFSFIDTGLAAGTYSYKVQYYRDNTLDATGVVQQCKLIAYEL